MINEIFMSRFNSSPGNFSYSEASSAGGIYFSTASLDDIGYSASRSFVILPHGKIMTGLLGEIVFQAGQETYYRISCYLGLGLFRWLNLGFMRIQNSYRHILNLDTSGFMIFPWTMSDFKALCNDSYNPVLYSLFAVMIFADMVPVRLSWAIGQSISLSAGFKY